mmetsp:Transcript_18587/g.46382  ORF Transcript_18587/g.46382 Transcript_18587/m.46382 type:complete len:313 (+) Transcript_18587:373-1311(+)|eukprot:CAMPEP_0178999094 /NCGR_PEP_ID=MMETSP0795-20121207/9864_1 /TAXON_ID=88552 /ORGANISM="Amoebophrya sp., Strain Ameob2" /LENGTH=312 /DNA_ID=CAMNT_0020691819 /DNA_START=294 /DNA_END=1232 /DNA_ORIENTATION=+
MEQKGGSASSSSKKSTLQYRLGSDFASAATATLGLSPFVCVIDKSIISNASGRQTLRECLKENFALLFTRPHKFARLPEYHYIYGVYFMTYISANFTDTICRHNGYDPMYPVFVATSLANMGCSIAKDRAFTRMFSVLANPKPLPIPSYLLFMVRDTLTIAGSFTLVPFGGRKYYEWINGDRAASSAGGPTSATSGRSSTPPVLGLAMQPLQGTTIASKREPPPERISRSQSVNLAQLTCPMLIQLVSTPLHLTALDLYNRPEASLADRFKFVRTQYFGAMTLRMCRIAPAFGFGGLGNRLLREWFAEGEIK